MDILRNNEPSFKKDSVEYAFRRALVDIISRVVFVEHVRVHSPAVMALFLHLIRTDNEEMAVSCLKHSIEIIRLLKNTSEEHVMEAVRIVPDLLKNMPGLVEEYLSENSPPLESNVSFPGIRSFKVLAEVPLILLAVMQMYRAIAFPIVTEVCMKAVDVRNYLFRF